MFNKNLESIDNQALKRRLAKISPEESRIGISYCVTPTNDYVLLKDDLPADDLQNPREAIKLMLKSNIKQEMKSTDIIIAFGMGLGYLIDELYNSYSSKIYLYEPDLNLLHFVLSNVDMSEILASGRVFLTNDLDELISKLSSTYITKDRVEIVYLPNYAMVKNKELLILTQKVFDSCKSKMIDINTITRFSKEWLANTIDNITYINKNKVYLLSDLESKFIGQTALIAGAGPSLADNIENIKQNRNKFVIFSVNKSTSYLVQNGIIPDFVVCLDAANMDRTLSGSEELFNKINAIVDIRTDKSIMKKGFHKIFVNFSETDFFIKKLAKYNSFMKFYESGGTASTMAFVSAIKMGFSKIVLAGIDLAFKDNVIYSYGETMNRVSQDEIVVDNIPKNLVQVKSVKGEMVYTRDDYQAFITHFETLIKELNYKEVYNLTSFGALIEGVKNIKFSELNLNTNSHIQPVAFVEPFTFNIQEFIQEEFCAINDIIRALSSGIFSTALVSKVIKSVLIYQYMQADILIVLQKNFDTELAQSFMENTKQAIKNVVEKLKDNKLI
ncbi:motility associated factor glycosyltransferase family protein [bacterium]|nr:motility associated factor glycosyltransferase family protein [bacterium]